MRRSGYRDPVPLVTLTDPDDPAVADYTRLTDVALRSRHEPSKGLYIAESSTVIRRAVAAGHRPRSFLMAPRWLESMADVLLEVGAGEHGDVPVYVADEEVLERLTGFHLHRGALAAMHRPPLAPVADLVAGARRVAILEDVVDHTNVGAAFRSAAALGVDAVLVTPRCADPLYRRSIKVSMGAVFAIPYARMTDWYHGLALLREAGFRTLALTPDQSVTPIDKVALGDRVALLLGSEGDGLSSRWLSEADERVCIPMSAQAMRMGVDSLNVVAAAAIACHGLVRDA